MLMIPPEIAPQAGRLVRLRFGFGVLGSKALTGGSWRGYEGVPAVRAEHDKPRFERSDSPADEDPHDRMSSKTRGKSWGKSWGMDRGEIGVTLDFSSHLNLNSWSR